MRILYFSRDYTPHDHRFLAALAGTEHEVHYLRLERRGHAQEERPIPERVNVVEWGGGRAPARLFDGPRLLTAFRRVLRRVRPDLVHVGPIQTSALLAAFSGFHPLVIMSWGSDLLLDADRNLIYRWATRYVLKRSDVLVGDCQAVREKAVAFAFPRESIVTFPWGVDLRKFSPGEDGGLRESLGWEDAFVLLHTRVWEPLYGVDLLARAFVQVAAQFANLRLLLLGGGSMEDDLKREFREAGLLDRVCFAGQVSYAELPRYYRAADLYVSASHSDGSSVSLMEALACGRPAMVSDIAGNCEWIEPEVHGWWFPDGDATSLADKILQAVQQRERLPAMGSAARKLAEARADWRQNFQKLLEAYQMAFD